MTINCTDKKNMKKIILLALAVLMVVECNIAMDSLDITNGSKFIVTSKKKKGQIYLYHLININGDSWYTYHYSDTTNFEVNDTLIIIVASARNVGKRNLNN